MTQHPARYITTDTKTGEIVHESTRHPLTQQLQRRVSPPRRRKPARRYVSRQEAELTLVAAVSCLAGYALAHLL